MKASHALLSVLLWAAVATAQPPDTLWTHWVGNFKVNGICTHGGSIFYGGSTDENLTVYGADANGVVNWQVVYGYGLGSQISDLETANSGALWVVGTIEHDSEHDEMLLSRFTMNGIVGQMDLSQWGAYRGDQIKRNAAGELFVTGQGITDSVRSLLFKLSGTGEILWSYASTDVFSLPWGDIAPTTDGGCLLADETDMVRLRKISADGQLEWDSLYAALPVTGWYVRMTALESGDYVVAYANIEPPSEQTFAKFSLFGALLAMRSYQIGDTELWPSPQEITADGDRIVSLAQSLTHSPLVVLNTDLDTLRTYDPMEFGLSPWYDTYAAAFTSDGGIVFSLFNVSLGGTVVKLGTTTGVSDAFPALPDAVTLGAYPNPFNSATTLTLQLTAPTDLSLTLFDVLGRSVMERRERAIAGEHSYTFDGTGLSSGIYFAHVQAGGITRTVRLVLMK